MYYVFLVKYFILNRIFVFIFPGFFNLDRRQIQHNL